MSRWGEASRRRVTWLAAAIGMLALCLMATAGTARAARGPHANGGSGQGRHSASKAGKHPSTEPAGETAGTHEGQLVSPQEVDAGTAARELGSTGQVDPLSGLGIRNPVCDSLGQIQNRQTRLACETNGTPEGDYPVTNYGFDIFVKTGVTHPVGDLLYGLATIMDGIWLGLLFVLKLIVELLGLAFSLNPFTDGPTMGRVTVSIRRIYAGITDPWLSTLIVSGGIWFAYKGLVRREVAAGVAGTLAAIVLLVVGLWVVHQPRASVGRLAAISDQVAQGVISAPQSGSLARPTGTYAEALSEVWSRLVDVPFAGLDFSDVRWALNRPPAEAVQRADEKFCADFGALALLAVLSQMGSTQAKEACASFARKRYGRPRRVLDLYLRSSPGSAARQALWDYFNGDDRYKAKVAAQGGDGALTRLSMLALFAIGLMGAVMLLAWLSVRLFTQAAIAFVLLLAAPFAVFFPLLGDSGRRAFKTWGLTLMGAVVAKVIYAAFLSVVLLGMAILGKSGDPTGFLLAAAFAWAVFLKRMDLIGWMSIGDVEGGRSVPPFAQFVAFAAGRRMTRQLTGVVSGTSRAATHALRRRASDGATVTRETAKGSLDDSARGLADHRYREAKKTMAKYEGAHGSSGRSGSRASDGSGERPKSAPDAAPEGADTSKRSAGAGGGASAGTGGDEEKSRYERAKELVRRADANEQRSGRRWSDGDLKKFSAEDRELLARSHDPADHAHRAGYERTQFEELRGQDRERAEEAIAKATKRDRQRLMVASETPGRIVGRGRQAMERVRQFKEDAGYSRGVTLRRLRRERRETAHRAHRRNLSRGV